MTGIEMLAHQFACPRCGVEAGARCKDVKAVLHVERYDVARASVVAEHGPQTTSRPSQTMSSYSSVYPGIDHLPTRLPHLDRYGHPWCIACHGRNGRAVAGDGLCDTCRGFNHGKPEHRRIAYGHGLAAVECHRCGQRLVVPPAAPRVCESCREAERQPQGEAMRLFQPAPNQLPGQLGF